MIDFPPEGLDGGRVRICIFKAQDIGERYIGWLNDPLVTRLSNQRFRRHDRGTCEAYFASFANSPNLFLSIRSKENDVAVGTMTIYADGNHGTADIGILLGDRDVWGTGLALEAWLLVVEWLLEQPGVRKVTAGTTAANAPMLALIEKSGMDFEGARKAQEIVEGEPMDILYFGRFAT